MISPVKKFTIFFIGDENILLKKLQKLGIVELENISFEGFKEQKISKYEVEEKLKKIEFLKGILTKYCNKFLEDKFPVTEEEEKEILEKFQIENIYNEYFSLYEEIERREKIIKKIEKIKEEIIPFISTEIIFSELFKLENFSFILFSLPKKRKIEIKEEFYIEMFGENEREKYFLLIFRKEEKTKAEEFLKKIGGKIFTVRKWNKKVSIIYEKLENIEKKNRQLIEQLLSRISKLEEFQKEIFIFYDFYLSFYEFLSAKEKLGMSRFIKGITGWIREKDIPILKKTFFEIFPDGYITFEEPKETDNIPIILENTRLIEPFEIVTDLYGRPVYKNIDPTGPLSLFFAISFGFCLGDAGYGLLLIILSIVLMKKFKLIPSFLKFLKLLLICGFSTFIIGALTGGWFGDTLYKLPEKWKIISFLRRVVVLNPLESGNKAVLFLIVTLIIGYIQIIWGLMLNVYNHIKNYPLKYWGESISLLLIQILVGLIATIFILTGKFLKIPLYLLLICFVYLMYEKARTQRELILKGFWAVYGVYSVISGNLLGDVLSYSRLFGLGLTSSILGMAINQMVLMAKNIPYIGVIIAFFIFTIGHFGNLGISLLGSYVHTSRLQYLEFFTKFFEGGGRVFKPFKLIRIYTVEIKK